jgi:hypothetical protein
LSSPVTAAQARAAAERAFAEGRARAATAGQLGEALAIHDERGAVTGWFVPMIAGSRIVGFVQLDSSLGFLRYASFADVADAEPPPEAVLWLDAESVRRTATRAARPGDELGEPVLSYHTTPSRLAWRVPLRRDGDPMTVYVAGEHAWAEPDEQR